MSTLTPRARALALAALVLGGVGIGVTEFVTMGLLPQIAEGVDVSVPRAADTISAYALGVVVGSPLVALGAARAPKRTVLVVLMVVFALGNAAAALAPDHPTLVLARFVSGLPHGAFFGVASLVIDGSEPVFGPVIIPVPTGEEAGELWDHVAAMSTKGYFFELKRTRH